MRNACVILAAATFAVTIVPAAQAGERWPVIPPEIGTAPRIGPVWLGYRCSAGPVYNFYHGAYYGEDPPALRHGYASRPYYRSTAYRPLPRTSFCVEVE